MPSRKSADLINVSCSVRSCSTASATASGSPARWVWRIARTASGADAAISLGQGVGAGAGVGVQLVAQPDAERLMAVDAAPGEQELEGALAAHRPRQRDRDAEALVEAEACEVGGEPGFRRSDAEVGGEGQAEPAAHGRALYGRHYRQRAGDQRHGVVIEGTQVIGVGPVR